MTSYNCYFNGEKMKYYEKGSEWRKWDFHLHTPSSFDYDDKSVTNEEIIQILKSKEISAAVITDHHYIDVEKIKDLAELGEKEDILILPGIEVRSELGGSEKIHFIGIFPIEDIDNTWEKIRGKLDLTDRDIKDIGEERIYKDLAESCEVFHKLGGINTVHAGTKTNSIENLKNYFLHKQQQKEDLLKNSIDILEIGKEGNIKDYSNIVFPEIKFEVPLVMGSDNHNINEYQLKQNCWIKADLSFEGLKQIIYEPKERVKIQEMCPDEKNDYEVIKSVRFEDDDFIDTEITLNSNLVSIIGGRSTGKSIFLRSIARAIDENYVEEVCGDISDLINPNTTVKWKNGKIDKSGVSLEDNSENKIKYIPQNFLNNKIEIAPDSYSNKLITDILKSDKTYQETFSKINNCIIQFETEIHTKITKLFETENKLNDLEKEQKELGSSDAIEKQIKILTEQYETFQIKDEISIKDIEVQEELIKDLDLQNKELTSVKGNYSTLNEFLEYLKHKKTFLDKDIVQNLDDDIKNEILIADTIYKYSLIDCVKEKNDLNKKNIETLQKSISTSEEDLKTLNAKINSSTQAKETFEKIEKEKNRSTLIHDKIKEIKKNEHEHEKLFSDIFNCYKLFIEKIEKEKNSFSFDSKEYNNFEAELIFKTQEFQKSLKNSLNNQKFSAFERKYKITLSNFKYDDKNFLKNLEIIVKAILNDILTRKKGKSKKEVLKELLGVYHFINFNIVEDGDKLEKMSPGKRSFALLKVLIESDKSKWPILIDQPEDDLDANSISKSLSQFLREKKKHRQIIIVSHNPNLVVGADSEQVIIANQAGSDSENKSKKFEYVSGSIENTYTNDKESCYLYCKGIKEHICDILEGGEESFKKRQHKYNIK